MTPHHDGRKGAASRPAVGKSGNHDLRVGNMQEATPKVGRLFKTPLQGMKNGTAFTDIDMFRVLVPTETANIAPTPPDGGDPLPRMGVGVAARGDQADVVAAVGLPTAQVTHQTLFERKGRIGKGWIHRLHRDDRGNDGRKGKRWQDAQTEEQVTEEPGHHATMERISNQT